MLTIRIIGSDQHLSEQLEKITLEVLDELGLTADLEIEKALSIQTGIVVLDSPTLLVNGRIISCGTMPSGSWLADQITAQANSTN